MVGLPYRVLIISSCTNQKVFNPPNMLLVDDFKALERLRVRERELSDYMLPAISMYTGRQHLFMCEGLKNLRSHFGYRCIDLKILSAGYGVLNQDDLIAPYNVSFSGMKSSEITEWAAFLRIKDKLDSIISEYDMVFFLLGESYLRALSFPLSVNDHQKVIFLSSWSCSSLIPNFDNYYVIGTGLEDATSFGSPLVAIKGLLFKLLCSEIVKNPDILHRVYDEPEYIHYLLYKHRKDVIARYYNLFSEESATTCEEVIANVRDTALNYRRKFAGFIVRDKNLAANYRAGKKIKFFIPEWDDRVDPYYDFSRDLHMRGEKTPYEHDLYAHEIFPSPNYDGILVSLTVLDNGKKEQISQNGIHSFLRFPKEYPVMADCGAFNYIYMDEPPFTTTEVLESYDMLGFNYGVSIDHLIVGPFESDPLIRKKRYEMTQVNAEEFIRLYHKGNYSFKPIGVAQGWDPESYRVSVKKLIDAGYDYIALGSLIPKTSRQIYEIMLAVSPIIPDYLDVHLFGITRTEGIRAFHQLGATSFDSAGPLRQAWLSAQSNYHTMERTESSYDYNRNGYKKYAAIRIPFVNSKGLPRTLIHNLNILEHRALNAIRLYGQRKMRVEDVLKAVEDYEHRHNDAIFFKLRKKLLGMRPTDLKAQMETLHVKKIDKKEVLKKHRELYHEVLTNRPWEKCDCPICREIGIEIIIFRGNNRNRRRGFHNTYIFNKQYRIALSDQ